jgi:AcrR family transcriptional regulator
MVEGSGNEERATRILDTAARLFAHYGYDKTTVDDIAREAGVSKGAVYLHWPGKEQLLLALIQREQARAGDEVLARLRADPQGGTLYAIYRHSLLVLAGNPLLRALVTRDSRVLGNVMRHRDPAIYTQRWLFAGEWARQMQAAGLVRSDLRPEVVAHILSIVTYGLIGIDSVIPAEQAPPLEEIAEALAEVIQRGLGAPGAGDGQAGTSALAKLLDDAHLAGNRPDIKD